MKIQKSLLLFAFLVVTVVVMPLQGQTVAVDTNSLAAAPNPEKPAALNLKTLADLSNLPDSEMVVHVNASRIINDAMPRLVPEKELQKMRSGMDQMKAFTNIDLRNLEFLVVAVRFKKPSGGTLFPLPEVMFAARGDFDAKALLGMAMMMSEGKLREEKLGDHSIYVLKLSDVAKGAANSPFGAAFSEIAITTLDANTLAVGNLAYIKAALEATSGTGRIKPELLASLMRDPNALISVTGSPLKAFAKSFGLRVAENLDPNCATRFGDYYMSLTMGTDSFKINGALNADNPDTASIIKNMLSGLLQQGRSYVPDKGAQTLLDQVKIISEGDEVLVEATIPQEMAAKFFRDIFAPPPPKAASTGVKAEVAQPAETKKVTKPKAKSRSTRRRT
jgi:hypothetical protein